MSFLRASAICKRFGGTVALDNVDLSVESGEIHALVGENGSGKSTLMRILAGVLQPDSGSIELGGAPFRPRGPMEARRAGIAMIHQELSICGDLTVAENIVLGVEAVSAGFLKLGEIRGIARNALSTLGYPDLDPDTPASELSVAMRQVVEIARSVAMQCRLVIFDEPTSSLAQADIEHLFAVVRKLKESGCAIVYISHFLNEIRDLCDRLTVLRDGVNVGARSTQGVTDAEIVRMMVGREISEMYPRSKRHPGEPLLEIRDLSGKTKPEKASLALRKGEVFGIAGLNGSGRTELLRAIFGLDPIKSGSAALSGASGRISPSERWADGMGMLSENRKEEGLLLNLSIADNIAMASLSTAIVNPSTIDAAGGEWIEKLKVKCQGPQQPVGELSGGNQQKVAIARMLYHGVEVLLLDEPTRGIDVGSKEQIYRLIDELALQGKAVLMVSSYLPELLGTCDRIAVMGKGVLSAPVNANETNQEELMNLAVGQ